MTIDVTNIPASLSQYEGIYRFAYVVGGNATPVPEGSRAVWFAKQAERRHSHAEVWSRNNAGDWSLDVKYQAELEKQVASLLPFDAEGAKDPKIFANMYFDVKSGPSARVAKTGLQASLTTLATTARTLAKYLGDGQRLTDSDISALMSAMEAAANELTK